MPEKLKKNTIPVFQSNPGNLVSPGCRRFGLVLAAVMVKANMEEFNVLK